MGGFAGFVSGIQKGMKNDTAKQLSGKLHQPKTLSKEDDSEKPSYTKAVTGENFKRGGMVRKTGLAHVHKGERVLTKRQQKRYAKKRG